MMFWDKERTINPLPPLTKEMVAYAEEQLQVTLPPLYLELLQQQNGGAIIHTAFPTTEKNSWADDHVHLDEMFGIAKDEGILQSAYLIREWNLPNSIVLFSGTGHEWFAFDYRQTTKNPPILYIETETDNVITLAENFQSFSQQLYEHIDEAEIYYVESTLDSSPERIRHVFSNINQYSVEEEIIPLIFGFNCGLDQQFVISMFILGMNHENERVRERICTTLYTILLEQELVEHELLEKFIEKVEEDEIFRDTIYVQVFKNFMK